MSTAAVATIIAAAVSSLGGAWAGAWLGLNRFKREKRFEKRLEWYRESVRKLSKASDEVRTLADPSPSSGLTNPSDSWGRVQESFLIMKEASLFAGPEALEEIAEIREKLVEAYRNRDGATPGYFRKVSGLLSTAADRLAESGKKELGFDEEAGIFGRLPIDALR